MIVLVINCGSSSIKYQLFDMPERKVLAKGLVEKIGESHSNLVHSARGEKHSRAISAPTHKEGMKVITAALTDKETGVIGDIREIKAVGHRVVHGGEKFTASVLIDDTVVGCIEDFFDLAPLHNPPNLTGIHSAQAALPGVPMVAVFDTAFHQTIPQQAFLYALPYEIYEKYRVRKYGFHGTSHAYVTEVAAGMLGKPLDKTCVITCHLGNGASVACVKDGKCIDTSMGMTPLPGLVMGTRCGDIDPAILFYLLGKDEYNDFHKLDKMLNKQSGLLGLSGVSNDMRNLCETAKSGGDGRAQLALDIFNYRLCFYIGAYMGVLDQVHAIVFTGGIGENNPSTRSEACKNLGNLGVVIDEEKNKSVFGGKQEDIAAVNSQVRVLVIPTDEEGKIASDTYQIVSAL